MLTHVANMTRVELEFLAFWAQWYPQKRVCAAYGGADRQIIYRAQKRLARGGAA